MEILILFQPLFCFDENELNGAAECDSLKEVIDKNGNFCYNF